MNDDLETLLQTDFLRPPNDFTERVMRRIQPRQYATPRASTAAARRWNLLRRLATVTGLVGGGLLGVSQLASFVLGLWLTGSAV